MKNDIDKFRIAKWRTCNSLGVEVPVDLKAVILFLTLLFSSCATGELYMNSPGKSVEQPPQEIPAYTIYAIGDAGEINRQSMAVMAQLTSITGNDTQPGMIVFLGDNIYNSGMPPDSNNKYYERAHDILRNQIDGLSCFKGKMVFIPGNHDWNGFAKNGLDVVREQSKFLNQLDPGRISFLPENGCGGPVPVVLNDNLVMLIIDSQWWIMSSAKEPRMNESCDIKSQKDFIKAFREQVAKYKDKQIIVAIHHPFYTYGSHGGHYSFKTHIFPLTALAKWLYVPLPIIGSIYPYYRLVVGHPEDLKSPRYHSLRDNLLKDLDYSGEMIFLSGHEHCLQYIRINEDHFLVSGSGSKQTAIVDGEGLVYGHKSAGFMKLDFYKNNSTWLTVYEVDPRKNSSQKVYSRPIIEKTSN